MTEESPGKLKTNKCSNRHCEDGIYFDPTQWELLKCPICELREKDVQIEVVSRNLEKNNFSYKGLLYN